MLGDLGDRGDDRGASPKMPWANGLPAVVAVGESCSPRSDRLGDVAVAGQSQTGLDGWSAPSPEFFRRVQNLSGLIDRSDELRPLELPGGCSAVLGADGPPTTESAELRRSDR